MTDKKDWNYIAAVEKAIVEKYGKQTAQDFRADWESSKENSYLNQIKQRSRQYHKKDTTEETLLGGGVVIKKRIKKHQDQRTCPVCKTYSFSRTDDLYMNRFECCEHCYIFFVEHREDQWRNGWRPDDDQVKDSLRRKKNV